MIRRITALLTVLFLSLTAVQGQYYTLNLDSQNPNQQVTIDRVFSGNTPYLRAILTERGAQANLTNWSFIFRYSYGQYDTNGMVTITGAATAGTNEVLFRGDTNLFFQPYDKYYWSISATHASGYIKTWGTGRMIQYYDPATATNLTTLMGQINMNWWTNNIGAQVGTNTTDIATLKTSNALWAVWIPLASNTAALGTNWITVLSNAFNSLTNQYIVFTNGYTTWTTAVVLATNGMQAAITGLQTTNGLLVTATGGMQTAITSLQASNALVVLATNALQTTVSSLQTSNALVVLATNALQTTVDSLQTSNALVVLATNAMQTTIASLQTSNSAAGVAGLAVTQATLVLQSTAISNLADHGMTAFNWGDHSTYGYLTAGTNTFEELRVANLTSVGSDICSNGNFVINLNGWTASPTVTWVSNATYGSRVQCAVGSSNTMTVTADPGWVTGAQYRVTWTQQVDAADIGFSMTVALGTETQISTVAQSTTRTNTFTYRGASNLTFTVTSSVNNVYLDTVTIREVTDGDVAVADDLFVGGNIYGPDWANAMAGIAQASQAVVVAAAAHYVGASGVGLTVVTNGTPGSGASTQTVVIAGDGGVAASNIAAWASNTAVVATNTATNAYLVAVGATNAGTNYLTLDGLRGMGAALNMGGNNVTNGGSVDAVRAYVGEKFTAGSNFSLGAGPFPIDGGGQGTLLLGQSIAGTGNNFVAIGSFLRMYDGALGGMSVGRGIAVTGIYATTFGSRKGGSHGLTNDLAYSFAVAYEKTGPISTGAYQLLVTSNGVYVPDLYVTNVTGNGYYLTNLPLSASSNGVNLGVVTNFDVQGMSVKVAGGVATITNTATAGGGMTAVTNNDFSTPGSTQTFSHIYLKTLLYGAGYDVSNADHVAANLYSMTNANNLVGVWGVSGPPGLSAGYAGGTFLGDGAILGGINDVALGRQAGGAGDNRTDVGYQAGNGIAANGCANVGDYASAGGNGSYGSSIGMYAFNGGGVGYGFAGGYNAGRNYNGVTNTIVGSWSDVTASGGTNVTTLGGNVRPYRHYNSVTLGRTSDTVYVQGALAAPGTWGGMLDRYPTGAVDNLYLSSPFPQAQTITNIETYLGTGSNLIGDVIVQYWSNRTYTLVFTGITWTVAASNFAVNIPIPTNNVIGFRITNGVGTNAFGSLRYGL